MDLWTLIVVSTTVLLGVYAVLFALPFLPGVIRLLTIQPNRYRPVIEPDDSAEEAKKKELIATEYRYPASVFGFFTDIQPGRVKLVEAQGGRFVRAIMHYPEHMFLGERSDNDLNPGNRDHWEVVPTGATHNPGSTTPRDEADRKRDRDTHPIPFPVRRNKWWTWLRLIPPYVVLSLLWWAWKRWVYYWRGVVWVGIPPLRQIRITRMPRLRIEREDSTTETHVRPVRTVVHNDYTDHARVQDFQFPVFIPNVNCQDNIPVAVIVNYIGRTSNPWSLAYDTDDLWPIRLFTAVSDAVTGFARFHPVSEVLTAKGEGVQRNQVQDLGAGNLSKHIARIGFRMSQADYLVGNRREPIEPSMGAFTSDGSAATFGIITPEGALPQIPDVSPVNDKDTERLSAPAFAAAQRDADVILAVGQAARTREQGRAIRDFPEGAVVPQIEGNVRTAEAAGKNNAIVIIGSGTGTTDPTQLAILAELRRLRGSQNGGQGGGTGP